MKFETKTQGHYDFIDITSQVSIIVEKSGVDDGAAVVHVAGSTAAITTMEFEDGIMQDIKELWEKIAPEHADYHHHKRWGDHNGGAHIKSAMIGTSETIPITGGQLDLGTWQQITLIDFDEKPRSRTIHVKIFPSHEG